MVALMVLGVFALQMDSITRETSVLDALRVEGSWKRRTHRTGASSRTDRGRKQARVACVARAASNNFQKCRLRPSRRMEGVTDGDVFGCLMDGFSHATLCRGRPTVLPRVHLTWC